MAIRKIARLGHPILRVPAEPVPPEKILSSDIKELIQDLRDTVIDENGAGLAAPQIFESKQIVLLEIEEEMTVWINPIIRPVSDEIVIGFEGCLSVPNMRGAVARYHKIQVDGFKEDGTTFSIELEDHSAVVAQHECDHLQGILYVDRVEPFTLTFLEEYKEYGHLLWAFIDDELEEE